jgi:hypothetical protein
MCLKKSLLFPLISVLLLSCWKYPGNDNDGGDYNRTKPKAWGYKPVYGTELAAKNISYSATPRAVISGGNIYAFNNYIFQVELGLGIHVINNTLPAAAGRIGFITVKGCSEISIRSDKLYTNSYDDLVVIDFSDLNNIREYSRLKGVFAEYKYGSPLAQPPASGYYECPAYDAFVTGWVRDSVYQACYKN